MARPRREPTEGELLDEAQPARKPWQPIRVTHYKIFTSVGRGIKGQRLEVPAAEAEQIIAQGHAVADV
jgi:hypothetical protein